MTERAQVLERLQEICLALPQARETTTFGNPTFQAGKKTFAVLDRYAGEDCVCFKAQLDVQRRLLGARRFFPSPFGAKHGWTCMRIDGRVPWAEVERLLVGSYRSVATKRMTAALDGVPAPVARKRAPRRRAPRRKRKV